MERPENNKWLDEALTETIGSEKPQTDFEQWKQQHPQAVEMLTSRAVREAPASPGPPMIRRIIMKSPITKLATAATIIIAVSIGVNQFGGSVESIAWADVTERFESVPFFNVTNYVGWGPYSQDQKLEFHKIETWKSENGQTRTHLGNEVIFEEFVDGNNVVVGFDISTKQPLNADRVAKWAKSSRASGFPNAKKGEFSLDSLLRDFFPDATGITPVDTADTAASRETVLFEVKHKTAQCSIWALRKSKLPVRVSVSDTKNKVYADFLFNYSERKDAKFFDPKAFASQ